MRSHLLLMIGIGLGAAGCAAESGDDSRAVASLTETIDDNASIASLGALASMVGESDEVREFGTKLTADHSQAKEEAVALAKSLGVRASDDAAGGDAEFNQLQSLSGKAFDTAFAQQMVAEYREDIAKTEQQAASSTPKLAEFAAKQLPTLRENLKAAEKLASAAPLAAAG